MLNMFARIKKKILKGFVCNCNPNLLQRYNEDFIS